jgi:hypothetical protein
MIRLRNPGFFFALSFKNLLRRSRAEKRGLSSSSQEEEEDKRLKLKASGMLSYLVA